MLEFQFHWVDFLHAVFWCIFMGVEVNTIFWTRVHLLRPPVDAPGPNFINGKSYQGRKGTKRGKKILTHYDGVGWKMWQKSEKTLPTPGKCRRPCKRATDAGMSELHTVLLQDFRQVCHALDARHIMWHSWSAIVMLLINHTQRHLRDTHEWHDRSVYLLKQ